MAGVDGCVWFFYVLFFFSWERLALSAWTTRRTAFGKMGKGFATYRGASTTAGSPGSTGRTGYSRCTWRDWMPSRRRSTPEPSHCLSDAAMKCWNTNKSFPFFVFLTTFTLLSQFYLPSIKYPRTISSKNKLVFFICKYYFKTCVGKCCRGFE